MRGVFVTGTGTGVGKTVVAATIARALAAAGEPVAVFKPALTGLAEPGEPDHEILRRAAGSRQGLEQVAPYRFEPPLSPHLAAELAGTRIDPTALLEAAREAGDDEAALVCEGVGGLLVPLTTGYLVRDFARDLHLPLVVAATPGLGTINHTLLTVESARAVGLEVCCVVLTPWPARPEAIETSNRETIERLGTAEVAVLERIDLSEPAEWPQMPEAVARRLRR